VLGDSMSEKFDMAVSASSTVSDIKRCVFAEKVRPPRRFGRVEAAWSAIAAEGVSDAGVYGGPSAPSKILGNECTDSAGSQPWVPIATWMLAHTSATNECGWAWVDVIRSG
jgi:hypothetical protein